MNTNMPGLGNIHLVIKSRGFGMRWAWIKPVSSTHFPRNLGWCTYPCYACVYLWNENDNSGVHPSLQVVMRNTWAKKHSGCLARGWRMVGSWRFLREWWFVELCDAAILNISNCNNVSSMELHCLLNVFIFWQQHRKGMRQGLSTPNLQMS